MTWLYGFLGLAIGVTIGWAMHVYVARAIEAESAEMRTLLRHIRNDRMPSSPAHVRHLIDRLLGDEAA